jgi:hypothetical protein
MMVTMGYVSGMSLGKNLHCVILPLNSQGRFEGGTEQDFGEHIKLRAPYSRAMRGIVMIDE